MPCLMSAAGCIARRALLMTATGHSLAMSKTVCQHTHARFPCNLIDVAIASHGPLCRSLASCELSLIDMCRYYDLSTHSNLQRHPIGSHMCGLSTKLSTWHQTIRPGEATTSTLAHSLLHLVSERRWQTTPSPPFGHSWACYNSLTPPH